MKAYFLLFSFVAALFADIQKGKDLYFVHCANCHSINMNGGMGKDFNLVSYTRPKEEIKAYAQNPSRNYRKFGYTSNAMPELSVNDGDLDEIVDFIDSLQPFKKWMKR